MRLITVVFSISLLLPALATNVSAQPHEWSRGQEIPGLVAYQGHVSAAWYKNELHVVTNDSDKNIKHARQVNGQWIAPVFLAHNHSGLVPDIAVCGGQLHMATLPGNFKIYHSLWDGRAWRDAEIIPEMETSQRVDITGMDGILHLTHSGKDSKKKRIWHTTNAGWGWGRDDTLPNQTARYTAAMAGLDGTLHMVYVSKNSNTAWHTTRSRWGEWTPPVQIPGVETGRAIDLAAANGRLFMIFTAGTSKYDGKQAPVAYCEWHDGRWSAPTTLKGYVCYGAPAVAAQPGLPEQIHLFLTTPKGVLHLQTVDKAELAPMKKQSVQRAE